MNARISIALIFFVTATFQANLAEPGAFTYASGLATAGSLETREQAMQTFSNLLRIPVERPTVSAGVKQILESEGFLIEDISWKSLDNEEALAYVIRSAAETDPLPAIICLHGSSGSRESMTTRRFGRGSWVRFGRDTSHQRLLGWGRELARHGFLVLALTQRGLDRRVPNTNDQSKELLLRGRTLMGAIVFEIRQALTYLQSRPDVDTTRIGVAGMSFGGITTFYTWLVDDRVKAAASICGGVGSLEVFLQLGSRGYHGFYWWIPGMLTEGDQGQFAAAMAPRPLMLWAPLGDIGMPSEGVDRFLEQVRPAYRRWGLLENLQVWRPPGEHAFTLEAFGAMKAFFDRQLR